VLVFYPLAPLSFLDLVELLFDHDIESIEQELKHPKGKHRKRDWELNCVF
jgi:hypothetical protein